MTMERYTHIIVGAGSAGCVLAYRLSEKPANRVLLLEAGPPADSPFIRMPKGVSEIDFAKYGWTMQVDRGSDAPPEIWLRGRTLGGSSAVNGMMYTRGQLEDFDLWEAMGNPGWGRAEMLRAYKAMERHDLGETELHGGAGPLPVTLHDEPTPVFDTLLAAAQAAGIPLTRDIGATGDEGAAFMPRTIRKGRRVTAADAFLKPARGRPNLTVLTGIDVQRVVFEGKRAVGVAALRSGKPVTFEAEGEVILSAGALHSPKLLMLSGIGPAEELSALGIAPLVDSPNVGKRLREHMMTYTYFRFARPFGYTRELQGLRLLRQVACYYTTRKGLMSWAPMELSAFFKTEHEARDQTGRADAMVTISPVLFDPDALGKKGMLSRDMGVTAFSYFLRPQSEGWLKLTAPDPAAPLHIRPNYLADKQDIPRSIAAFRGLRRIFATPPLEPYGVEEVGPAAGATTDAEILAHMRQAGKAAYHAVGTCRMGSAPDDVVDPHLRVRGVEGLRVIDVSVLPTLPQHTNGPAMAVGWRGSDLVLGLG